MIYQSTYFMRFFLHPTFSIINIVPKLVQISTSYNNTFCYLNWCSDTTYTVMEPFWSHIVKQCKCYKTLRISAIFYNDIVIQAILSIIFKLNTRMTSGASILCQVIQITLLADILIAAETYDIFIILVLSYSLLDISLLISFPSVPARFQICCCQFRCRNQCITIERHLLVFSLELLL